jgi:hypothetical protein
METREYSRGWLRAFFDGEGSVSVSNHNISFSNTEPSVIDDALRHLAVFDITPRSYETHRPPHKPITRLVLSRRDQVIRFAEDIGSSIPHKQAGINSLLAWYARPNQKRDVRWGDAVVPTREQLETLLGKGLRHREIGALLGIPPTTIGHYIRGYGLGRERRQGPPPDPESVRRAYWDEGLSITELGLRYGYKGPTIVKFMEQHGIPRRLSHWKIADSSVHSK